MAETGVVGGRMVSPALVGRGRELALLAATVSSPPAVVVVEGEAGIGKTRLMSELRDRLGGERRFVSGWCHRIREPFPLGPVIEAVRTLGGDLAATTLSPVAGALRPLLPEVAEVLPAPPPPLDDRVAERHRVFRALAEVIGSLGRVVLVLEDLHWADQQTIDFVSYLLTDQPAELSLLVTFRGEEAEARVRVLTAKLPTSVSREHLVLTLLDEQQTGALATAILGTGRVSRQLAGYLHARTSGLPFAIEELLALPRVRTALTRGGGSWQRLDLEQLDVPTGIRDSVLERVSRLSADARRAVEAAAVLQAPVPESVLISTCQAPKTRAVRAMEEALEAGLLARDGEKVGFRHLLAAQALYDATPQTRRRQLHSRAARGLEAVDPTPLGHLAHHLHHAGRLAQWVVAAERAADQAVALGHDDEAVRLLTDVLEHAPLDPDQRGRIAVKVARTAVETLRARDVLGLLWEMPEQDLPKPLRSELRFWLALLLDQTGGDPLLQRRLLAETVEELADRPDLRAWAMVGLGIPTCPGVPPAEHLRWLHRSLEILPDLADPTLEILVLGKVAMVLTSVGDPAWRHLTDRMLAQTNGSPRRRREVNAYDSVGIDACYAGHHETAHQLLTAGLAGAAVCESRQLELRSRTGLALLDFCRGCWEGLGERLELLEDELADYTPGRIDVEIVSGCLALARGDLDDAQRRLSEVTQDIEGLGGFDVLPIPVAALIRLATAHGHVEWAVATGLRLLAAVESKGVWAPAARVLPPLSQAMVVAGRTRDARRLVNRLAGKFRDLDAPLAPAVLRHALGFVAAGALRWQPAAEHFLAAADRYEMLVCPYEAAQAREQAAVSLLAAADARPEQPMQAALETYQRLRATWDAARAASTARRHGMSLPNLHRRGRRGYGDDLSPREREVAQLAGAGHTNEAIARELFLSPKTVDKHVCAALRKLGLHSRRSLADHLGDTAGRPADDKNGVLTP